MEYERLKLLRENAELTQQQVADLLHCQREVYRRYESGLREIPVWALIVLSRYYKVSTDYILELTDTKKTYPARK